MQASFLIVPTFSAETDTSGSTHPLAREVRFSLLLFGFETLKGSHLDILCEHQLRYNLYRAAFSWFGTRPQYVSLSVRRCSRSISARWSYGSNRVQIDADIKLLSEFLNHLQTDMIRGYPAISSLNPGQSPSHVSRESPRR